MTKPKMGDTVKINYKAKTANETVFDSTTLPEPLTIIIGKADIIPAFEKALLEMTPGEKKSIQLESKDAFGPYLKELITSVKRANLPNDIALKIGQQLQVQQPDGGVIIVTVKELSDDEVIFDANHPLAGKDLTFDIELLELV